jgi:hypothetical protein
VAEKVEGEEEVKEDEAPKEEKKETPITKDSYKRAKQVVKILKAYKPKK